ncbi:hypothetical protein E2320_012031 [Naja naja]|nr:hypothetical protein E2320_012031 [Naja naja]
MDFGITFLEFLNWGQRHKSKDKGEEVKSIYLQNAGMLHSKSEGNKIVIGVEFYFHHPLMRISPQWTNLELDLPIASNTYGSSNNWKKLQTHQPLLVGVSLHFAQFCLDL